MTRSDSRTQEQIEASTRVLLAVLAAAAGIIHLAMVPSHWGESGVEGFGFALVGWAQVTLAVALLVRPSRALVRIGMVATYVFIAVWVISRVWGLPFGEHAGHPHDPSFVDLTCVGIEVAFVAFVGVVLCRPKIGQSRSRVQYGVAALASVAVLALATAALASPSARNHAAVSHGGHSHSQEVAADGHATHSHVSTADVKSGWAALGENGHQHGSGTAELDDASQAALSVQLAPTAELIQKYPTLAAAEAAGYRRAGRFNPGLGVHYGAFAGRVPTVPSPVSMAR